LKGEPIPEKAVWNIYVPTYAKMSYSGQHWHTNGSLQGTPQIWAIDYATSSDGIHWTKYSGNPVLTAGASGSFHKLV